WREWGLVVVARQERLDLVGPRAVYADEVLSLAVVAVQHLVADRPVASLAADVVGDIGTTVVEALEAKVGRGVAERDPAVVLGPATDHLRGVPFDRGAICVVRPAVDVRLVVEVGLDLARIVRRALVGHAVNVEDLFGAIRDQFVAAELAPPGRRLVTGPEKRPLFEDEHGLSRFGQSVGDRRAAGAAADDDEIELGPHRAPSS